MNFFDHKGLGNHLLQLCPKVVKRPVYIYIYIYYVVTLQTQLWLSATRILPYSDLLLYVMVIILILCNFSTRSKHPEDGAKAPKHVGVFVT